MRAVYAVCAFLQHAVHAGAHERREKYCDASGVLRRVYGRCRYGRGVGAGSREGCNDDTRRDDGNCSLCEEMGRSFFFFGQQEWSSRQRGMEKRITICWSVYRFPMKMRPRSIDTASPASKRASSLSP